MPQEQKNCGAKNYTECKLGQTIVLINAGVGHVNNYIELAKTAPTPEIRQMHLLSARRQNNRVKSYERELKYGCGNCTSFITESLTPDAQFLLEH